MSNAGKNGRRRFLTIYENTLQLLTIFPLQPLYLSLPHNFCFFFAYFLIVCFNFYFHYCRFGNHKISLPCYCGVTFRWCYIFQLLLFQLSSNSFIHIAHSSYTRRVWRKVRRTEDAHRLFDKFTFYGGGGFIGEIEIENNRTMQKLPQWIYAYIHVQKSSAWSELCLPIHLCIMLQ